MENKEEIVQQKETMQPMRDEELENAAGGVCAPSSWEAYCPTCQAFLPPQSVSNDECPVCGSGLIYPKG